jgi:hypothetical protein
MRKGQILCVLAVLVITACGHSIGKAVITETPSPPVGSPSAQPSPATPSPSPSSDAFNLTCSLPVVDNYDAGNTNRGWITFPGGQFSRDSSRQSDGIYDWAIHAWLPQYAQVAADGLTYVIPGPETSKGPGAVTIVDAKTGSRKVIHLTRGPSASQVWLLLGYETSGIFLGALTTFGAEIPSRATGLWLLDPRTGRVRLVDGSHNWELFGGGFAWRLDDPQIVGGTLTKVYRLDLTSLQSTAWYQSKSTMGMESPTSDGELLAWYGDNNQLALLGPSHLFTPVVLPPEIDLASSTFLWNVARPGVWITDDAGLALYVKGAGVRFVATNSRPADPDSRYLYVAGDCR